MLRPHIVILGAGFGGTYVAKKLAPHVKKGEIDVTIVNKTNYFLFTPLLHEVATGSLSPTSVAEPLREIFVNTGISLCQGTVEAIDRLNERVHISANGSRHTIPYDYLVIATGAESNYYNIPGAAQFSMPLKSLWDAVRIRSRIIDAFEKAIVTEDPNERAHLLSFAIVGGGPTGVETAAELAEFIDDMVKRYYFINRECEPDEPRVFLIHTGNELLPSFAPSLRKDAEERLTSKGINLVMGRMVTAVTPKGLNLSDNSAISAATVIWAAGVKPSIPDFEGDAPMIVAGRLQVDRYFRVSGDDRVFALGDAAAYIDDDAKSKASPPSPYSPSAPSSPPTPVAVPMLAQVAVKEANILAKNILSSISGNRLKKFHYHSMGSMVSVGQWFAIGEIFSMKIAGKLTWWIWRTVYLFKFASWRKRIRIAFEWTLDLFYPRDVTKLT